MPRLGLYVAITNHGFGHATRVAAVLAELQQRRPEIELTLVTCAPEWLLRACIPGPFTYRPKVLDIGVVQGDSRFMDQGATLAKLKDIRDRQAEIITEESAFIRDQGLGLVLGDIPPLAGPIAKAAGVPCWMMGNFGWDYIYQPWVAENALFGELCRWIGDCFGKCDRLFRLPFHEPMAAFPKIEDVGLTGGNPNHEAEVLRQRFGITAPKAKTVLMTFGGLGIDDIPYAGLSNFPDWQFITLDRDVPELPNLCRVDGVEYRPVDFMPLCDRILSKPGYGTFSEACRQNVGVMTIQREGFSETPLLMAGLKQQLPHRILSDEDFFRGDWAFLREPLVPAGSDNKLTHGGNGQIAEAISAFFAQPEQV